MMAAHDEAAVATNEGVPVLHRALTASFHLDWASPDQEEGMGEAMDLVQSWLGEHLTWTWSGLVGIPEPFRVEDLRYVAHYPGSLPEVDVSGMTRPHAADIITVEANRRSGITIACKGGPRGAMSSPFGFEFHADIDGFAPERGLLAPMAIKIAVPLTWDLADFERRVVEIAEVLPLRWASAGYGYSRWGSLYYQDAERALYAHARRHPGYDAGYDVTFLTDFLDELRTVSWLTFLGPDFASALVQFRDQPLSGTPHTSVRAVGSHLLVKAGPAPAEGDVNRLDVPRAYVEADALLRPLRRREGVSFANEWTESSTEAWLRRFERILS